MYLCRVLHMFIKYNIRINIIPYKLGILIVLNLATRPPFVGQLESFGKAIQEFGKVADFIIVYISEAHAADEWNIPGPNQEKA